MNADIDLPKGTVTVDKKDLIDPSGGGNLISANAEEKRSKEDLLAILSDPSDLPFAYKIVSNSVIMKFQINLRRGFDVNKDEVKFGFYLHLDQMISST